MLNTGRFSAETRLRRFISFFFSFMAVMPKATRPASPKDETSPASTAESKPTAVFRFRNVSAAVFPQEVKTDAGAVRTAFSISLKKSYKDAKGEWQNSHTLWPDDLPLAVMALQKCYEHLMERGESAEA